MAIGDFSAELKDLLFRETVLPQRVEGFDALMKEALSAAEVLAPLIEEFVGRHALANVPAAFQALGTHGGTVPPSVPRAPSPLTTPPA